MSSPISGSGLIQTATLRICFGLMSLVAAHSAQSAKGFFAPDMDISTIQSVRSSADWLHPYQFRARFALTRLPDSAHIGLGLGTTTQLTHVTEPRSETIHTAYDRNHISLPHFLRIDFKGEQVNIALQPRSVLLDRENFKLTLQYQSALIEGKQFKVLLQPNSALMLWSKAF